ncbi:MAG TPA: HEAT repeat domain-containing protein [Woeseiaceae bacterium]|nr:HEAT repeat domain-containing protein [Woeseiaceae bacterium]
MTRAARAFLLSVLLGSTAAAAQLHAFDTDGWHTWRVEAVEGAPAWCCFNRDEANARSRDCNLDSRFGYGSCDGSATTGGLVQVYAKIEDGRPVELRVLSPECPVEVEGSVADLGEIDTEASFEWLSGLVRSGSRVSEDAMAAIAMHRGDAPLRFLTDAANGRAEGEIRKSAIFWLGQVRIPEASGTIERLMLSGDRPDIRQHAAFALSQSTSPNRTEALIRQGREDPNGDTRSQAWFWLAQTGARESEEAIRRAVAGDPDRDVREEAVFALSQLPEDRAVDALISVLRDRGLPREVREAALFWLAQSESDRALAIVERLLVGGGAGAHDPASITRPVRDF